MSIFSGKQRKGAMREHSAAKRREADERNAKHAIQLACGHATTLDPDVHAERCGALEASR